MIAAADASPGVRRYFDPTFRAAAVKILPGECYVTADPGEMLVTVLGSCVAACVYDLERRIGGMNHFMLPTSLDGYWGKTAAASRYGNFAMRRLVEEVIALGARPEDLQIKAFGGASFSAAHSIGDQNADFLEDYLRRRHLTLTAQLLRPSCPLRVHFFPADGRAFVLPLEGDFAGVGEAEATYRRRIATLPPAAAPFVEKSHA